MSDVLLSCNTLQIILQVGTRSTFYTKLDEAGASHDVSQSHRCLGTNSAQGELQTVPRGAKSLQFRLLGSPDQAVALFCHVSSVRFELIASDSLFLFVACFESLCVTLLKPAHEELQF